MRPLLILLIILVVGISADDEDYSNPVELESLHMDYESKTIILRESKKLVVTCTYAKDDIADTSDLQWKHEGGKNIDESSSPSVFTVGLRTLKTGYRKRNLHFSGVHKRDAGTYVCYGKNLDGTTFQNSVKIDVLDDIAWTDPATEAGALVGEPLTIDCSVKSRSSGEPQIQITNGDGEALDPEDYTIAGNEVTIKEMTRYFDGQKISCVHVELVTRGKDSDFPLVDRKDVEIVAWYKPEFDEDVKELYTIVSEKNSQPGHATLYCNVTASSPAATHFVFYRGSEALTDSAKYELTKQGAELKIKDLNQDDLDEYKCEVNNGKVKATQIIHLKEANPPPEPKVSMEKHKKHSIVWKVESSENEGELPIIEVQIEYIRKSILHERDIDSDEDDEISNGIWERYGKLVNRPKAKNNLYEITGLRQGSDYRFRFRLISQAGAGELMSLSARTADTIPLEDENSLPCSLLISSLSVLMLSSLW